MASNANLEEFDLGSLQPQDIQVSGPGTLEKVLTPVGGILGPVARGVENYLGGTLGAIKAVGQGVANLNKQPEQPSKEWAQANFPNGTFKLFGEEKRPEDVRKNLQEGGKKLVENIPTADFLHDLTKKYTGKALEPDSFIGRTLQDIGGDIGGFLSPTNRLLGLPPSTKAIGKTVALASGVNLVANVAKEAGVGDTGISLLKTAGYIIPPFFGIPKAIDNAKNQLYGLGDEIARNNTLKGTTVESLADSIGKFENSLETRANPGVHLVQDIAARIKKALKIPNFTERGMFTEQPGGELHFDMKKVPEPMEASVQDLWNMKKDINANMGELMKDPKKNGLAIKQLHDLRVKVDDVLQDFGKRNKQFGQVFNQANELNRAIENKSWLGDTIEKATALNKMKYNPLVYMMLGKFDIDPTSLLVGAGTAAVARHAVETVDILRQSKVARNIAGKIIIDAEKRSAPALIKHVTQLSKEFDKYSTPENKESGQLEEFDLSSL